MALDADLSAAMEDVRARTAAADDLAASFRYDRAMKLATREDVALAIAELEAARQPLTAHVRGQTYERRRDPVWQANAEATRALRRLRAMRDRPTRGRGSGTPRPKAPEGTRASVEGACARTKQVLDFLAADLRVRRKVLGRGKRLPMPNGGWALSMAELNEEAADLLPDLDRARRTLNLHWARYDRSLAARIEAAKQAGRNPYEVQDEHQRLWAKVDRLRDEARHLRREIAAAATQTEPDSPRDARELYERWTPDDVTASYVAFYAGHDRWPTKRDHIPANGLPHATQVRRVYGANALTRARAAAAALIE